MKKTLLSVALTATIATSAFAHNTATQEDLNFAFNNVQLENVTLLSKQEMKETRGEFGPIGAFFGGAIGFAHYAGEVASGEKEFSYSEAFDNFTAGAAVGAFTGGLSNLAFAGAAITSYGLGYFGR